MNEFAIGIHGDTDYRLVKWEESTQTETVISTFDHSPTLAESVESLMDHHGTGDSPFSSREGATDSLVLTNNWPLRTRNMTLPDENMPWDDPERDNE